MIALELAAEFPHMLRSLTLIAIHAGGPLGIAPVVGMARFVRSACRAARGGYGASGLTHAPSHACAPPRPAASTLPPQGDEEAVRILLSILYSPAALADPATYTKLYRHHLQTRKTRGPPVLLSSVAQIAAVLRHNVSQERLLRLRHSGIAMQVIVGTHDLLVRTQNSHRIAATLDCPLHVIHGGGHVLTRERPAEVNKLLLDHVRAAAAAAAAAPAGRQALEAETGAEGPSSKASPRPAHSCTHPDHAAAFHDASQRAVLAVDTPAPVRRALQLAPRQRPSTVLHCVEGAASAAATTLLALRLVEPLLPRSRLARWLRTRANALVAAAAAAVALSRATAAGRARFAAWRHAHRHGVLDALPGMTPPFGAAAVALVSIAVLRGAAWRAL